MLSFPNAKINLGLNVICKRADGFHELETIFYPVPLHDCLEVITAPGNDTPFIFSATGLMVSGNEEHNLCVKAYRLLKKNFPRLPALRMHLHKAIPMGAGMGGGSADAAFTLCLLNDKYKLGLSAEQLMDYALQLGSDVPFFINNEPCFATGRGEILESINIDLSHYSIVLINPDIHVSTSWAFSQLQPAMPVRSIKEIIRQPISTWKTDLVNDFEAAVFTTHPVIRTIKDELYTQGALYTAMSGSGSTVFGIFEKEKETTFNFPKEYFIRYV